MREEGGRRSPFDCRLTVRRYREYSDKLTGSLRAVIIADLHSTLYGERQELLLEAVRRLRPDLILMPGDIADHKVPLKGTRLLLEGIRGMCPAFYVSGNHEQWTGRMPELIRLFEEHGVRTLAGETAQVTVRGERLLIGGVDDPHAFTTSHHALRLDERWKRQLLRCCSDTGRERYGILLSHRPELTRYYRDCGFDLVVAGHAHGGQFRLPGPARNGLLAPHQGFFPRYAGGRYRLGSTSLIVSRGLCKNRLPRIWNPPELALVKLCGRG